MVEVAPTGPTRGHHEVATCATFRAAVFIAPGAFQASAWSMVRVGRAPEWIPGRHGSLEPVRTTRRRYPWREGKRFNTGRVRSVLERRRMRRCVRHTGRLLLLLRLREYIRQPLRRVITAKRGLRRGVLPSGWGRRLGAQPSVQACRRRRSCSGTGTDVGCVSSSVYRTRRSVAVE